MKSDKRRFRRTLAKAVRMAEKCGFKSGGVGDMWRQSIKRHLRNFKR